MHQDSKSFDSIRRENTPFNEIFLNHPSAIELEVILDQESNELLGSERQITLSMQLFSYVPHSKTDEKHDTASSFLHLGCPAPAVLLVQVNMEEIQELLGFLEAAHEHSEPK
jgi:hypothetical protein